MNKISKHQSIILKDTRGANLVEYIMLVGLIAVICIMVFQKFGKKVHSTVEGQTGALNTVPSAVTE